MLCDAFVLFLSAPRSRGLILKYAGLVITLERVHTRMRPSDNIYAIVEKSRCSRVTLSEDLIGSATENLSVGSSRLTLPQIADPGVSFILASDP